MNMICESLKAFFPLEIFDLPDKELKYAKYFFEWLRKIRTKFYEVAGHVGRVKTAITNQLGKMFRSRIHKAAERNRAAGTNSDKWTETNSYFAFNSAGFRWWGNKNVFVISVIV